jgi:SAM-dependent methyltransferase
MDNPQRELMTGRFYRLLQQEHEGRDIIAFGCGNSFLPVVLARIFPASNILGYDRNVEKLERLRAYLAERDYYAHHHVLSSVMPFKDRLTLSHELPARRFDTAVSLAVFHEGPSQVIEEMLGLVKPGGLVAILDYDMKGMAADDFFRRWGYHRDEERERQELGDAGSYRLHTQVGLKECEREMSARGVRTLAALGKQEATWFEGPEPTLHFIYLGRQEREGITTLPRPSSPAMPLALPSRSR